MRKVREGEVTADLYGFLTTTPNAEVGAVHPKAMPIILTTSDEVDRWIRRRCPKHSPCSGRCRIARFRSWHGA